MIENTKKEEAIHNLNNRGICKIIEEYANYPRCCDSNSNDQIADCMGQQSRKGS